MMRNIEHFVFLITSILTLVLERLRATSTSDGKRYKYFTICTWYTRTWHIDIKEYDISLRKELAKTTTLPTPRHQPIIHNSTTSKKKHHPQIHGKQSFFFLKKWEAVFTGTPLVHESLIHGGHPAMVMGSYDHKMR